MKTQEEVEKRLRKLRRRYARKHIQRSQDRLPCNCIHNEEHLPVGDLRAPIPTELEISPRIQRTLVVLQNHNPGPVRLCMYGAADGEWSGTICDSESTSRPCPYFQPRLPADSAKIEFLDTLADNEHVFDNYRDMATLQWVLGERVYDMPLTLIDRVVLWFTVLFALVPRASRRESIPQLPSDLWDDDDSPAPPGP